MCCCSPHEPGTQPLQTGRGCGLWAVGWSHVTSRRKAPPGICCLGLAMPVETSVLGELQVAELQWASSPRCPLANQGRIPLSVSLSSMERPVPPSDRCPPPAAAPPLQAGLLAQLAPRQSTAGALQQCGMDGKKQLG